MARRFPGCCVWCPWWSSAVAFTSAAPAAPAATLAVLELEIGRWLAVRCLCQSHLHVSVLVRVKLREVVLVPHSSHFATEAPGMASDAAKVTERAVALPYVEGMTCVVLHILEVTVTRHGITVHRIRALPCRENMPSWRVVHVLLSWCCCRIIMGS